MTKSDRGKNVYSPRGALAASGIPFDKKPFSPHITLVREPRGELPPGVLPPAEMHAERVSLYKSERGPGGMIYTELGSAAARGEPETR